MENNSVVLSLEQYNELRDFKLCIEKNNTCKVFRTRYGNTIDYISKDEAIADMNEEIVILEKENFNLKHPVHKEISIEEIRCMNWREFRKWKKTGEI